MTCLVYKAEGQFSIHPMQTFPWCGKFELPLLVFSRRLSFFNLNYYTKAIQSCELDVILSTYLKEGHRMLLSTQPVIFPLISHFNSKKDFLFGSFSKARGEIF